MSCAQRCLWCGFGLLLTLFFNGCISTRQPWYGRRSTDPALSQGTLYLRVASKTQRRRILRARKKQKRRFRRYARVRARTLNPSQEWVSVRKTPLRWNRSLPVVKSPPLSRCRRVLLKKARASLGQVINRCNRVANYARYRSDCVGWVRCMYANLGIDIFRVPGFKAPSGVMLAHEFIRRHGLLHRGLPAPGDMVFWHGTIDRGKNGRLDDDLLTHIGMVEKVEADGRISILHTGYGIKPGVNRIYMTLRQPKVYKRKVPSTKAPYYITKRTWRSLPLCRRYNRQRKRCWRSLKGYYQKGTQSWKSKRKQCLKISRKSGYYCTKIVKRLRRTIPRIYNHFLVSARTRKVALGHTTAQLFAGFGSLTFCPDSRQMPLSLIQQPPSPLFSDTSTRPASLVEQTSWLLPTWSTTRSPWKSISVLPRPTNQTSP